MTQPWQIIRSFPFCTCLFYQDDLWCNIVNSVSVIAMQSLSPTHIFLCTVSLTHTRACAHYLVAHTHSYTHTHTHSLSLSHTHTDTYACSHTHYKYACTHKHTHTFEKKCVFRRTMLKQDIVCVTRQRRSVGTAFCSTAHGEATQLCTQSGRSGSPAVHHQRQTQHLRPGPGWFSRLQDRAQPVRHVRPSKYGTNMHTAFICL